MSRERRQSRASSSYQEATGNQNIPYVFQISLMENEVCLQCKHRVTKDVFEKLITKADLQDLGIHYSLKALVNRLGTALQGEAPEELRIFYWFTTPDEPKRKMKLHEVDSNCTVALHETDKYDDEPKIWYFRLPQCERDQAEKLGERLDDLEALIQRTQVSTKKKFETVVVQFKDKISKNEEQVKEGFEKLSQRTRKLAEKIVQLDENVDVSVSTSAGSTNRSMEDTVRKLIQRFDAKEAELLSKIERISKQHQEEVDELKQDIRTLKSRLVKWKSRRDFTRETAYIDYIVQMLDKWKSHQNPGYSVFVKVINPVGKCKQYAGRIGEIMKYNTQLCWVRWPAFPNVPVDTYNWSNLDIFIPESSFYYPLGDFQTGKVGEQMDSGKAGVKGSPFAQGTRRRNASNLLL